MPTIDSNLNSSNLQQQPETTNQSGHNSVNTNPIVAQIIAATQSIIAMDLTPPPSLFSYSLVDISFERHSNTVPIISKQRILQKVLSRLEKLNKDPDVLYMSELRKRPNAEQINKHLTKTVEEYGFKRTNDVEYVYTGSDPACVLRNLLSVRPLVLDCATALHLLTYQALLESLYRMDFNTYIEKSCDGDLSINKQIPPPLPTNRTAYYSTLDEKNENPLPEALKMGDHLWIQGPADGYAFHPDGKQHCAFNVLVDTNGSEQPSLIGFYRCNDTVIPTYGRWSYAELRNLLLENYNSPLTLRDIQILHAESKKKYKKPCLIAV